MSVIAATQHLQETLLAQLASLNIQFNEDDIARILRASDNVSFKAYIWIQDEMQRQCAIKLSQNIYNAIKTGKYGGYKPYNKRYQSWKRRYFPQKGPWQIKDDLAKNVRAFPLQSSGYGRPWAAGVPNGAMDTGGKSWFGDGTGGRRKKEIAMYGSINERVRPLFKPETKSFRDNEWRGFGRRALVKIGGGWK